MFITKPMRDGKRLSLEFYQRDTIDIARDLLGKVLVHAPHGGPRLEGLIVETEAYLGMDDPAAHSFGGRRTPRTEVMFGRAGLSYVYFIYGVHFCFNVVTAKEGVPEAVLVRAVSVPGADPKWANGPGKLCRALGLGRAQNARDLIHDGELFLEDHGLSVKDEEILSGPRIGIGAVGDHIVWPLRFGVRGHPALSPYRF